MFNVTASFRSGELERLLSVLGGLKKQSLQNRIMRPAVSKSTRVIAKKAKANLKRPAQPGWKGTKLLQKSIGSKIKTYKGAVVGLVGVRKGFKKQIGVRTKGKSKGKPVFHNPAMIAHLVEYGHGGPHAAPARPFLRPALDQSRAEVQAIFVRELTAGINSKTKSGDFSIGKLLRG